MKKRKKDWESIILWAIGISIIITLALRGFNII